MSDRLELHHVEHLLKACERSWPNGSKESLLLGGAMAVVATIVKQRDAAEDALAAAREDAERYRALRAAGIYRKLGLWTCAALDELADRERNREGK